MINLPDIVMVTRFYLKYSLLCRRKYSWPRHIHCASYESNCTANTYL